MRDVVAKPDAGGVEDGGGSSHRSVGGGGGGSQNHRGVRRSLAGGDSRRRDDGRREKDGRRGGSRGRGRSDNGNRDSGTRDDRRSGDGSGGGDCRGHLGSGECLLEDARALQDELTLAGVKVQLRQLVRQLCGRDNQYAGCGTAGTEETLTQIFARHRAGVGRRGGGDEDHGERRDGGLLGVLVLEGRKERVG